MSKPLQVLVVEDSEADALLLLRQLRLGGFAPVSQRVETPAALTAALAAQPWDVVISDYRLPQFNGMDALKLVQATGRDVPFILVSGAIGEDLAVALMKAGAHDYLLKDQLTRLAPAVGRELGDAEARRQRRAAEEALRQSEERFRTLAAATFEGIAFTERGRFVEANEQLLQMLKCDRHDLIGREITAFVPLEDRARVLANVQANRESHLEHRLVCQDGTRLTVEARGRTVEYLGAQVRITAIRDITARKHAEQELARLNIELESRVQQRTAELEGVNALLHQTLRGWRALSECNAAILRATSETELLAKLCRTIVEIGGYRMAWVGLAENDGPKSVRPVAQAGFEDGYLADAHVSWTDTPRGRGPTGIAIRTGQPSICRNILHDPRLKPWRQDAAKRGYASSAALPILGEGQCLGALTVYATEADAFSGQELTLLQELVGNISFGLVAMRSRAERVRLEKEIVGVAEREQERIAQDFHDGVLQHLAGIAYMAEALAQQLGERGLAEQSEAARIARLLATTMAQARRLVRGMHAFTLEREGLSGALTELATYTSELFNVACTARNGRAVPINEPSTAAHLLRIAQEAVNNALKHGQARHIEIALTAVAGDLELTVTDDGRGIPKRVPPTGMGLRIMRSRAALIPATLTIERRQPRGTIVTCRVPLGRAEKG